MNANAKTSTVRIGTRGSLLATTQTEWAVSQLRPAPSECRFPDDNRSNYGRHPERNSPFRQSERRACSFVKEIEQALLRHEIDVGIHSLKDMPNTLPDGLMVGCIPQREDPYDAFVCNIAGSLDDLKPGALVGTSSARRRASIMAYRPDLNIVELRGNLDTRLRKLNEGQYDAIIVACAGLHRLGLSHVITSVMPEHICLPAVGQGALALETRQDDEKTAALLAAIHNAEAGDCVAAERSFARVIRWWVQRANSGAC